MSVIKVKTSVYPVDWIYVALDGNEPRLIFPHSRIDPESLRIYDNKVSFVFESNKKKVVIKFGSYFDAEEFHEFVLWPTYQRIN